jgi:hypothetical protein
MDTKILVIYVGIAGIRTEDVPDFVNKVTKKIAPTMFEGEIIIIPVQSVDTKIECVNPVYITEAELILQHTELMKKLNDALHSQLEILKEKNNE